MPQCPNVTSTRGLHNPLTLNSDTTVQAGSVEALAEAIRRGADLRIVTHFRHNEHVDTSSDNSEVVHELAEFRVTYLLDDRWTAGIMSQRQPVNLPDGFGPRASMSFFLYNQNGQQAIARPHLDGAASTGTPGPAPLDDHSAMPKYHQHDSWDAETNAPSSNFIYDFDLYQFWVRDDWREVLAHDPDGAVTAGSIDALGDALARGCEIKAGVRGLCDDLTAASAYALDHEVFVQLGSCYFYTESKLFVGGSHPLVRVAPAIPLLYASRGWDFGWLIARSDGLVSRRLCDPYTLQFHDSEQRHSIRWFAR